ncbi:MAG: nucleoside kinase [Clostridia bacterium]|nr:nucleoside kinase [Clostridia bacterium]
MFTVNLQDKPIELAQKTPILSVIKNDDKHFVAAKVNNRLRELTYELSFDCDVELLNLTDRDAVKVYETSLRYLLAMAFHNLYPDYQIKLSYGISRSIMVSILEPNDVKMDKHMLKSVLAEMDRLVALDLPFVRTTMTKEEAYDYFVQSNYPDKAEALQYRPEKICHFYKCGDYLNYMYGYMVPSTGYLHTYKLFCYDGHIIAQYPRYEVGGQIPVFQDEPTFAKVQKRAYRWAKLCNAEVISKINDHITEDTYVDFMQMNETLHNDMLHELGDKIVGDIDNIRLICIAGPSSSGKTTFSNRLRIELMSRGITPLRISLDMYYKNREDIPLDENGEKDFECLESLDVALFNDHITSLIAGEEVELPIYQFGSGRTAEGIKTKIDSHTPIIIEGIHALNDQLSYSIPKHHKFKIYIAPQFQINLDMHNPISYTDIRLLRRIVRDKKYRDSSAERTLEMWSSVRRGEFKWIYPFQEGCNYVFNSALTYEMCVMKKYALPALREVQSNSPHYITANRLIKFLKYFKDMDDKWVPCNSLLREFIGGSCFAEVDE